MADRSSQLVLAALTRAAAEASGVPLYTSKAAPGLFPTSALGKQAAQRCRDEGLLHAVASDRPEGKAGPRCAITDKGLAFLLGQVSPRQVLEDFVRVLEAREAQVGQLIAAARQVHAELESLRGTLEPVLESVSRPAGGNGALKALFRDFCQDRPLADGAAAVVAALERWPGGGAEDCPLPELFRQASAVCPGLTVGAFHDVLRTLLDSGRIYLHPWTGPMYDIPEPPYALLVGHEVAYYASLRIADCRLQIAD